MRTNYSVVDNLLKWRSSHRKATWGSNMFALPQVSHILLFGLQLAEVIAKIPEEYALGIGGTVSIIPK